MNRLTRAVMLIGVLFQWSYSCQAQEINPAGGSIQIGTPKTEDPSESLYRLGATGLVFRYPAGFKSENPQTFGQRSYRAIFALNPDKDPDRVGADPCSPTILAVGLESPESAMSGKKKDDFAASPPTGGITLVDVDRKCIESKDDEEVTANLVGRVQGIDGLTSVTPPSQVPVYKLDGHAAALAVAQGFSKDKHGKRKASAGITIVGSVSLSYKEHLLVWTFIANDVALFNRMLKSRVQFDDQPSWPLIPFSLQAKN